MAKLGKTKVNISYFSIIALIAYGLIFSPAQAQNDRQRAQQSAMPPAMPAAMAPAPRPAAMAPAPRPAATQTIPLPPPPAPPPPEVTAAPLPEPPVPEYPLGPISRGDATSPNREAYFLHEAIAYPSLATEGCSERRTQPSSNGLCFGPGRPFRIPKEARIQILGQAQFDVNLQPVPEDRWNFTPYRELWFRVRYTFDNAGSMVTGEAWVYVGPGSNLIGFRNRVDPGTELTVQQQPVSPAVQAVREEQATWRRFLRQLPGLSRLLAPPQQEAPRVEGRVEPIIEEPPLAATPQSSDPAIPAVPNIRDSLPLPPVPPPLPPREQPNVAVPSPPLLPAAPSQGGGAASTLETICGLRLMNRQVGGFLRDNTNALGFLNTLKSPEELATYLRCYASSPEAHEDYLRQYRALIRHASQSFGIPEAMLTCLLFRESAHWNRNVVRNHGRRSSAGAMGIGQFMQNTVSAVNRVITLRIDAQTSAEYRQNVRDWHQRNAATQGGIAKNYIYERAHVGLMYEELRGDWARYFTRARKDPATAYHRRGTAEVVPRRFETAQAYDPVYAIGASALWLKHLMLDMDASLLEHRRAPISHDPQGNFMIDFLEVITGIYNRGNGIIDRLSRVNPPSVSAWKRTLGEVCETRAHMASIRACMQRGNAQGPTTIRQSDPCVFNENRQSCNLGGQNGR